jgi:RimJ/RimL family protein N-acetyltransferase
MLLEAITKSVEHLRTWMPWANDEPSSLDDKINLIRIFRGQFDLGTDFIYGIFNKTETEIIGGTGLHPRIGKYAKEIGYWISVHHINQGFATETAHALTKVGFEIDKLDRIEIHCAPDNIQSRNIPQKLGYTLEAILKNRTVDSQGNPRDTMIWTLFKDDYQKSSLKSMSLRAFDCIGRKLNIE